MGVKTPRTNSGAEQQRPAGASETEGEDASSETSERASKQASERKLYQSKSLPARRLQLFQASQLSPPRPSALCVVVAVVVVVLAEQPQPRPREAKSGERRGEAAASERAGEHALGAPPRLWADLPEDGGRGAVLTALAGTRGRGI